MGLSCLVLLIYIIHHNPLLILNKAVKTMALHRNLKCIRANLSVIIMMCINTWELELYFILINIMVKLYINYFVIKKLSIFWILNTRTMFNVVCICCIHTKFNQHEYKFLNSHVYNICSNLTIYFKRVSL